MLLYLDTCSLNRPFDDQTQLRVLAESEAVLAILSRVASGQVQLASSAVLQFEVQRIADQTRRQGVEHFLGYAAVYQPLSPSVETRAAAFVQSGFKKLDALHLASAEELRADVFLSTDDRLVSRAQATAGLIKLTVLNPMFFNHSTP